MAEETRTTPAAIDESLLEQELTRVKHQNRFIAVLRSTVSSLIVVAAAAVILAMLVLPVLQITGTSMTETLNDGDIVVALRGSGYKTGDVVAFYYNNNILIKRVIARRPVGEHRQRRHGLRGQRQARRALRLREGPGRLRHHPPIPGARRPHLRDGRPSQHIA